MPYISIKTSEGASDTVEEELMKNVSATVSEVTGKGEQYIMVAIQRSKMRFAGKSGKTAFVELCSIGGLNSNVNKILSQKICHIINSLLQIPQNRIYISFNEVKAENWGWNGSTFA